MRKYNKPELSISLFDVEDVITVSGVVTEGYEAAEAEFGELFYDEQLTQPATTDENAAYFSWER